MNCKHHILDTLRQLALGPVIIVGLLSIIATGGGDGGSTPTTGGDDVYQGNTNPATITTTNASTLIGNLLAFSDLAAGGPPGPMPRAAQDALGARPHSSARELPERLEIYYWYWATVSQAQREAATGRVTAAFEPYDLACLNYNPPEGLIHFSGTLNADGTGTVNVSYNNCKLYDGLTYNGQATLRIDAVDLYLRITDFTFTTSNLTSTGPDTDESFSGSMRDQRNITADTDTETVTFNMVKTDNIRDKQIKSENVFVIVIDFVVPAATLDIMGRAYDSIHGYVDVSPVVSFVLPGDLWIFPIGGYHVLTGAGNARIRVTALSGVLVTVELDLDGDNVYELTAYLQWTDIGEPIGADLGDDDMDGMHNSWETFYGLNPSDPSDGGSSDNDFDTFTNVQEYQAGTDPTDPFSHP